MLVQSWVADGPADSGVTTMTYRPEHLMVAYPARDPITPDRAHSWAIWLEQRPARGATTYAAAAALSRWARHT